MIFIPHFSCLKYVYNNVDYTILFCNSDELFYIL